MKAVLITKSNQQMLIMRYSANPDDLDQFPVGYYMIAGWGDNGEYRYEGCVSEEKLNELFIVGKTIDNGFMAIAPRPGVRI